MPEETILSTANRQERYRSLIQKSRHTKESSLFASKVYRVAMSFECSEASREASLCMIWFRITSHCPRNR